MADLREEDIREIFIRSSGPGGQNVNKVATAVFLLHIPTGITVKCQKFRTQYKNRIYARELLTAAVLRADQQKHRKLLDAKEQERRRNRLRPQALKENILALKKMRAKKKTDRKPVRYPQE